MKSLIVTYSYLFLLSVLVTGCADDPQEVVEPVCYQDFRNPACIQVSFATLSDGMVINRANDQNNALLGIQYSIRMRLSRPAPGSALSLQRQGSVESLLVFETDDTDEIVFDNYTLVFGPNDLVSELYDANGVLIDRVSITVYGE